MQETNTWILEITSHEKYLSMSLHEKEQQFPLKAISTVPIDFTKIKQLNSEIIAIINRADRRKTLTEDSIGEFKKNTRLLYDLLFSRQIKNQLTSLESVNLVLSLDEKLISIPWELLFDGKDFLCLKFNLGRSIRTQNSPLQPPYRSIPVKPKMLIFANPTGDLKSAYQEGLHIKNCLTKRGKISVDFKAQDIDSNYVCKNLRDYDIIHFAGHCEYNGKNPEESGWVLSDGWFSARDFLTLGENATLPSIVFVNACQSARVTDDLLNSQAQNNIYSLAQAFLFAGVRHYLGSFWRVEDNFSKEFAEEFYNQVTNDQSIGKAARLARLRLFRHYGISAIAWAGYVLYGEPSFVLISSPVTNARNILANAGFAKFFLPFFQHRHRSDGAKNHLLFSNKTKVVIFSLVLLIIISLVSAKFLPTLHPSSYFLFSKAEHFYTQGNNHQSIGSLSQIIKQDPLYLSAWRLRGDIYFRLGKFPAALGDYSDYARYSERKSDFKHLATAYIKIAWTYHMWGDYQKSKELYQKALSLSQKHQDKLNEADAMARLAVWYIDKGDNETAFS